LNRQYDNETNEMSLAERSHGIPGTDSRRTLGLPDLLVPVKGCAPRDPWFENFRLRHSLPAGREGAKAFWADQVKLEGVEREEWSRKRLRLTQFVKEEMVQ
jgi:hypothetical protein